MAETATPPRRRPAGRRRLSIGQPPANAALLASQRRAAQRRARLDREHEVRSLLRRLRAR